MYDTQYQFVGFPEAQLGSNRLLGINQDICFDRYGRFHASGLLDESGTRKAAADIDWDRVDWATLQRECVAENYGRFDPEPRPEPDTREYLESSRKEPEVGQARKRAAVIFRAYDGIEFTPDLKRTMRSVITELALGSGGEYEVFLLFQIKGIDIALDDPNQSYYQELLHEKVPEEFQSIAVLWNERLWETLYPLVPPDVRE